MPRFTIANRHPPTQPAAIVRAAGQREQAAILDLLLRANRDYRKVLPARIFESYVRDLRMLAAAWADKDFLIAESDGTLVGAVAFYRDASVQGLGLPAEWAALRALAVDPEARGRGIGQQLAEACVLRAWRMGRQFIALHSAEFQEGARKLSLTMGFQRCPQYDFNVGDRSAADLKGKRLAMDAFSLNLKR